MTDIPNEDRLATELGAVIAALEEAKVTMTCANEALASSDYRCMSEDLWRSAAAAERAAVHFRGAAALAQRISEGRP